MLQNHSWSPTIRPGLQKHSRITSGPPESLRGLQTHSHSQDSESLPDLQYHSPASESLPDSHRTHMELAFLTRDHLSYGYGARRVGSSPRRGERGEARIRARSCGVAGGYIYIYIYIYILDGGRAKATPPSNPGTQVFDSFFVFVFDLCFGYLFLFSMSDVVLIFDDICNFVLFITQISDSLSICDPFFLILVAQNHRFRSLIFNFRSLGPPGLASGLPGSPQGSPRPARTRKGTIFHPQRDPF